jgi:tetratricopeptide (TPR) repeat protein
MKTWLWTSLLVICLGLSLPLQRWMDGQRGAAAVIEDSLYVSSGKTLRRMSLGFDALLADLYWLRTIQYFGDKMQQVKGPIKITNVKDWRLDLLEPLLTITTELDPNFVQAWRFGGTFLPDISPERGIRFVQRGIENNPDEWRLYQDLAYIYWKQGRYQEASETYGRGGAINGAPAWLKTLQAVLLLKGGERETAREIFRRMYEESDDDYTKKLSLARLKSLQAEDEMALLGRLLDAWRERNGSCPHSLPVLVRSLSPPLRNQMVQGGMQFDDNYLPLDPEGFPYDYNPSTCTIALAEKSAIVRWNSY